MSNNAPLEPREHVTGEGKGKAADDGGRRFEAERAKKKKNKEGRKEGGEDEVEAPAKIEFQDEKEEGEGIKERDLGIGEKWFTRKCVRIPER